MMRNRHFYSGGHRVNDGGVRLLGATTFQELVEKFVNCPVAINMPKDQFLKLPIESQREIKSVAYFTSCSFKDYDGSRNDENAKQLELAFLDIDSGDLAEQIWSAPEVLADQLGDVNFVLHSTATHTPEVPRLRLIVDIEPMSCERHAHVIAHVASLLGADKKWSGYRESTVLSQAMFRPVVFAGETTSPVVISRTNGRALTEAEVPDMTQQPEALRKYSAEGFLEEESIEFMPLRVTMAEVKSALQAIDPDCDYRAWYEVAAGLRHQFRTEEEAAEAYDLFDEWSATGTKYTPEGPNSTYTKWKSFRPYRPGRPPVTIRTLFHHAIKYGYNIAPTLDRLISEFDAWVQAQTSSITLSETYAARIRALPGVTPVVENTLCSKVAKRYSQLSGSNTTAAVIQAQLRKERKKPLFKSDDSTPAWLRPFVYVSDSNKFVNTTNMTKFTPESYNFMFNEFMMTPDQEGSRPSMIATDYATNVVKIPKAVSEVYDPRWAGSEPIFSKDGVNYLNTYRATYPEPDASKSEEAGKIFITHMKKLIAEEEYWTILIDFLAFLVQHPGVKIRWTIVIQSVQGAGKGLVGKIMEAVLGKGNVKPVSNNIVSSIWNDWATGSQLIIIEELHSSGQVRKALADGIKEALTNDDLPINKRNTSAYVVENTTNFLCFTNEQSALAIDPGERRYMVIKSPICEKSQADALQASGWFVELARLKEELAPGFRHFLLNWKISKEFNANGNAPATKYTTEMVEDSEPAGITAIKNLIDDEDHPYINEKFISIRCLTTALGNNFARPSHYLRDMGFEKRLERVRCGTKHPTDVWGPRGSSVEDIKAAVEQVTNNEKTTEL